MENIKKRRLQIRAFHIDEVVVDSTTSLKQNTLTISKNLLYQSDHIKKVKLQIIKPNNKNISINSILDFIPISSKVLGEIGEGITHTFTGVKVMLTGADESGVQVAEFGSSEGILEKQVAFNRAGTPLDTDILIHMDIILKKGKTKNREAINECHRVSDEYLSSIRSILKEIPSDEASEKHIYYDEINPRGKKVVILKQVAGQGAMYDTRVFSDEPSGFKGGISIIDIGNMPVLVTPNEYRDGAIRAMH